jgi:hypothetical protein
LQPLPLAPKKNRRGEAGTVGATGAVAVVKSSDLKTRPAKKKIGIRVRQINHPDRKRIPVRVRATRIAKRRRRTKAPVVKTARGKARVTRL